MRADGAAGAQVRERIQSSARTTAVISLAAVLISVLSLFLILRENRRQRQIAEMSRRSAEQAELASRAKSRFLTMMSHELRNPLNGVLGPLALLGQSDMAGEQQRLVVQAQQSGQSMLQMLSGLLDYGEMQDGRFHLRSEPFRDRRAGRRHPRRAARRRRRWRDGRGAAGHAGADARRPRPAAAGLRASDALRARGPRSPGRPSSRFGHDGGNLIGEIAGRGGGDDRLEARSPDGPERDRARTR